MMVIIVVTIYSNGSSHSIVIPLAFKVYRGHTLFAYFIFTISPCGYIQCKVHQADVLENCTRIDNCKSLYIIMSSPPPSGDILFFPVRLSVCLSVRHKSCPLYNLKTVKDFSLKLGTLVNHDETMCHAQES